MGSIWFGVVLTSALEVSFLEVVVACTDVPAVVDVLLVPATVLEAASLCVVVARTDVPKLVEGLLVIVVSMSSTVEPSLVDHIDTP